MKCTHEKLSFEAGGFYVVCDKCHAVWAAVRNHGCDQVYEPDRSDAALSREDVRVALECSVGYLVRDGRCGKHGTACLVPQKQSGPT